MNKLFAIAILAGCTFAAKAQVSTTTNCQRNGDQISCQSQSTDYGAQQRAAYAAGQQVGSAVGTLIGHGIMMHRMHSQTKQYCKTHNPGDSLTFTAPNGERYNFFCPVKN
jgi:phage tail tape-measure protein